VSGPARVDDALALAARRRFPYACDDSVGRLLAVFAASTQRQGRVLELGTGCGVGTAWIVSGLGDRTDVEVVTVEIDAALSNATQALQWPSFVRFIVGDAVDALPSIGRFDLIFADAVGGKWERLDLTVAAMNASGLLVVDDIPPMKTGPPSRPHSRQKFAGRSSVTRHSSAASSTGRAGSSSPAGTCAPLMRASSHERVSDVARLGWR
jgi:demethylmenaquinone methyltransferase/2-methoxy-6-polyprenyl-1,4-benzoquinol methylase